MVSLFRGSRHITAQTALYSAADIIVCLKEQNPPRWFKLVCISGVGFQLDSFEDLVRETHAKQMVAGDLDFVKSARSTTHSRCAMEDLSQGKPFYEESIDEPN